MTSHEDQWERRIDERAEIKAEEHVVSERREEEAVHRVKTAALELWRAITRSRRGR